MLVDFLHNTNSVERALTYDADTRIIRRFDGSHWMLANDTDIHVHDLGDGHRLLQYTGVLMRMPECFSSTKELKQGMDYNGQSVRAVILCNNKLLLVQRGLTCSHSPGAWELPGGYRHYNETLQSAVRRELTEETGLIAKRCSSQPMHMLDDFVPEQMWTEFYYRLYMKSAEHALKTASPQEPEIMALTWCSIDAIRSMMNGGGFTYSANYFLDGWLRQLNGENFDEGMARHYANRQCRG